LIVSRPQGLATHVSILRLKALPIPVHAKTAM
jgi:hypothetical protein